MLTQDRLKYWLNYDLETGLFSWIRSPTTPVREGSKAGTEHLGYVRIRLDGKKYMAHRLAWLYVYGDFPKDQIDHINGVKNDNRLVNLREASNSQNCMNKNITAQNNSGYKGVHWDKSSKKWRASCRIKGKLHNIGRYKEIMDAVQAYDEFAKTAFGEFNPIT